MERTGIEPVTSGLQRLAALRIVPVLTARDADEAERACHAQGRRAVGQIRVRSR
jgi:hypothetical protein